MKKTNLQVRMALMMMSIEFVVLASLSVGFATWLTKVDRFRGDYLAIVGILALTVITAIGTLINLVHYLHTGRFEDII